LTLDLKQQRFLLSAPPARALAQGQWEIPICAKDPSGTTTCDVMRAPSAARTIAPPAGSRAADGACPPWVFINAGAKGYYRTAYPSAMLRAMAPDVQTKLTAAERLSLVGDEWALVRAGKHTVADYL